MIKYLYVLIVFQFINCNQFENCKIKKIFFCPVDDEGSKIKRFILAKDHNLMDSIYEFGNSNSLITVSDSSMCEISKLMDTANLIEYNSIKLNQYYHNNENYQLLIIGENEDTISNKVISLIKNKFLLKNILKIVELDKNSKYKKQKLKSIFELHMKYKTLSHKELYCEFSIDKRFDSLNRIYYFENKRVFDSLDRIDSC